MSFNLDLKKVFVQLAGISYNSAEINGPGLRQVYFAQGCPHHCKGCFNPETWSEFGGKKYSLEFLIKDLEKNYSMLEGITLSGGDPILQYKLFLPLILKAKELKLDVWCWTGYTFEELTTFMQTDYELVTFLNNIDVLVDGKFVINKAVKNLKTLEEQEKYKLRGSTNQRIIDVKQSLKQNKVILYKFN